MSKRFWSVVIMTVLLLLVGISVAQARSDPGAVCVPLVAQAQVEATPTAGEVVAVDEVTSADGVVTMIREKMPDWAVWLLGGVFVLIAGLAYYALYLAQRSQWHISNSVPASSLTNFLRQTGYSAGTAALELVSDRVEASKITWDDALLDALKPRLMAILDEYFKAKASEPITPPEGEPEAVG